jgi:tetratricopeptide (TPR) repeat protein
MFAKLRPTPASAATEPMPVPKPYELSHFRLAATAMVALAIGAGLAAAAGTTSSDEALPPLTPSPLGHYLASRHAELTRDLPAAADLLAFALDADPDNPQLLETSFNVMVSDGRLKDALAVAKRMESVGALDAPARVALAIDKAQANDYPAADRYLAGIRGEGLERFMRPMLLAWTQLKVKGIEAAVRAAGPLGDINGFEPLYELQLGMLYDVAKQPTEAAKHYDKALETASDRAFRMIQIVANFRLRQGDRKGAQALYAEFEKRHPRTLLTASLRKAMQSGDKPAPIVASATSGMAEQLFNLAVLLQGQSSDDIALIMARLALAARPGDPIFDVLVADVLDAQSRSDEALAIYRKVPPDGPYGWQAEIKVGEELHKLDRDDEAVAYLQKLVASRPERIEAAVELGDVLRAEKRFAEAAKSYDKAIDRLGPPLPGDWSVFYFRGIALERSDQWPKAELDFKKALQLAPDHPYVLNYLGYTWVDRGVHLDEAIGMLRRAVDQKPEDGFIIDSLAWAYYRLKQYDKAVIYQEKAVSLEPGDPVLNDHLGDIYWKLGRHNEARFQWQRALAFKPDPDQVKPIEAKLQHGLDAAGTGG